MWRRWIESWYISYALLGAAIAGLAPILLPLMVIRIGGAAEVGFVMAAFSLGGLTAPLWGNLADRYRLHRWLLTLGLAVAAVGLAIFPFTSILTVWLGLAIFQGGGAAAASTVANLFVVEAHPRAEWDERIGWLQTFYAAGQVGGLLLAGALGQVDPRGGLLVAGGMAILAVLPGWWTTRTPLAPLRPKPVPLHPPRHTEWPAVSPQRVFHHLTPEAMRRLGPALRSPFGLFLVVWLLSFGGSAALFSLYPVLMQEAYGISPAVSSIGFAVAAGLGLALYSPAGRWSEGFGPSRVLQLALGVRVLAFLGLFALGIAPSGALGWLALPGFAFVVLAWSLLSVSGTTLTARLSPVGEGIGMGVFNATTALASVVGAAAGGLVAGTMGYVEVSALAAAGNAVGLVLSLAIRADRQDGAKADPSHGNG